MVLKHILWPRTIKTTTYRRQKTAKSFNLWVKAILKGLVSPRHNTLYVDPHVLYPLESHACA